MYTIGVDGGAFSGNQQEQFGNYSISFELMGALTAADSVNRYTVYTLKNYNALRAKNFSCRAVRPKTGWLSVGITIEELLRRHDFFLALNQAVPLYTPARIIALCHGLSFLKYPTLYPDSAQKMKQQLTTLVTRKALIVVSSKRVKKELLEVMPHVQNRRVVILPFGVPSSFLKKSAMRRKKKYLLFVGMGHPIKNVPFLINAFRELATDPRFSSYQLMLVGPSKKFFNTLDARSIQKKIIHIPYANRPKLKRLYAEAACVVTASLYESFNLPVLEALSQNTQVVGTVSAVIPELSPYATISAPHPKRFAAAVKQAVQKPKNIDIDTLKNQFSWARYAQQVISLYTKFVQ